MDIFETLLSQFNSQISVWEPIALDIARRLFFLLASLQIIWAGILWMMNINDPTHQLMEFFKRIIVIAFFWTIIDQSGNWIPAIINSFRQAGEQMTGVAQLSPGDVVRKGIHIATTLMSASQQGGLLEKIAGAFFAVVVGVLVFLAFLYIALEMVLVLIGGKIILVGGLIMLGFAGSQWTSDFTQKYFVTCIHIGLKILFLTLIVGIAEGLSDTWPDLIKKSIADKHLFETYFSILAAALLYVTLVLRVPDMGASMLTGSFGMGFGSASIVGGAVLGAGYAINKLKGVPANVAGGVSALYQAGAGGVSKGLANPSGIAGKIGAGILTASGSLLSASALHLTENMGNAVSKTSGGKIANYIKTLNAANQKFVFKK